VNVIIVTTTVGVKTMTIIVSAVRVANSAVVKTIILIVAGIIIVRFVLMALARIAA
jgi:hypothetical protein